MFTMTRRGVLGTRVGRVAAELTVASHAAAGQCHRGRAMAVKNAPPLDMTPLINVTINAH